MRVRIRRIAEKEKEQVVIECVEVTSQVEDIYAYAKAKGEEICGILTCTIPEEERSRQIERLASNPNRSPGIKIVPITASMMVIHAVIIKKESRKSVAVFLFFSHFI